MILLPTSVEVHVARTPWANLALIAVTVLISALALGDALPVGLVDAMVLDGMNPVGWVGHLFLHAGYLHLIGNLIYLWVFGNAVCDRVGNAAYAPLYLGLGVLAAWTHLLVDRDMAIGASGAVNGIIGFYVVMYPTNRVTCWYWIFYRTGTFQIAGRWLVLIWLALDAWGAFKGGDRIAYAAHLGGLAAGFLGGWVAVKARWVNLESYDNPTLPDLLSGSGPSVRRRDGSVSPGPEMRPRARDSAPPLLPDMVSFACPHCEKTVSLVIPPQATQVYCPRCRGQIHLEDA